MPPSSFTKVPANALFVSTPNPTWFGNPVGNSGEGWDESDWLKSRFHFAFAEWGEGKPNFGVLRVLNDDRVQPARGFGTHPHRDMEIITYIVEGELTHQDSMGTAETLGRGSVQFMTAGTGVRHSEHNRNPAKPLRFIQMWIMPNRRGLEPNYGSASTDHAARHNQWCHVVGSAGASHGAPVSINQDANIFVTEMDAHKSMLFDIAPGRQAYVVCLEGSTQAAHGGGADKLDRHEAAELVGEQRLELSAGDGGAHMLVVEMAGPK